MKSFRAGVLLMVMAGCNINNAEPHIPTLDSNVAGTPDSIPAILHLDSHRVDTPFRVALDSAGTTITPQDTNYPHPK